MESVRIVTLGFALTCSVMALGAESADREEKVQRASELVRILEESDAPGCALGVLNAEDGTWIHRAAFGLADLDKGIANTPETVFGIASATKQFTAAATAIAAHEGHLSLDDDIRKYVPEIPKYDDAIKVRHLVHHTNGLRDIIRLRILTGKSKYYSSQERLLQLLSRQRSVNFPAGEEYRYGNSGMLLLAIIIERATGEALPDYIEDRIFHPLGMEHSYFGVYTRGDKGRALPYSNRNGEWQTDDERLKVSQIYGAGGMMTTIDDYGRWAANLLADDSRIPGGTALTRMLRTPGELNDGSPVGYGFGLNLEPYKGLETISHGGSEFGYKASTYIFPKGGFGFVGFCNNGSYAQPMVKRLADIFLDLPVVEETVESQEAVVHVKDEALHKFEGTYREPTLRLPMVVDAREGSLYVTGDVAPYNFYPTSARQFQSDARTVVEFAEEVEGVVPFFVQRGDGKYGSGRFERIEVVVPTTKQLLAYEGDFYSVELDATYRFEVEDKKLTASIILDREPDEISQPFTFEPMLKGEFVDVANRLALRFSSNGPGAPSRFTLTAQFGWVTDVEFERVQE